MEPRDERFKHLFRIRRLCTNRGPHAQLVLYTIDSQPVQFNNNNETNNGIYFCSSDNTESKHIQNKSRQAIASSNLHMRARIWMKPNATMATMETASSTRYEWWWIIINIYVNNKAIRFYAMICCASRWIHFMIFDPGMCSLTSAKFFEEFFDTISMENSIMVNKWREESTCCRDYRHRRRRRTFAVHPICASASSSSFFFFIIIETVNSE